MTSTKLRCVAHCGRVVPGADADRAAGPGWIVVGCGYVGTQLARRLATEGHRVAITRRDLTAAQQIAAQLDPLRPSAGPPIRALAMDLARATPSFAPHSIVVCLAPPGPDPTGEIEALARISAGSRLVYVSSTAVYKPGAGAWVDESWPIEPVTAAGGARVAAERSLPGDAVALRVAGIYGPGRGIVARLVSGSYRIVGDGSAHVSRIHVEDLVEAIVRAGTSRVTGPINIADDDPAPLGELADRLAARLGVAAPPRVPVSTVDPEVAGMLTADRRIAARRMKRDLGVVLRYPNLWSSLDRVASVDE